jgi:hypothetical protein
MNRILVLGILGIASVALVVLLTIPTEVAVISPKQDIPAKELLDPLIERGAFKEIMVPTDLLVEGAVTDLDEMRGTITTTPIFENEQVTTYRLSNKDGPY